VEDVLREGQEIQVKVIEVDKAGKIRLSRRDLLREAGEKGEEPGQPQPPSEERSGSGSGRPHGGHGGRRSSGR
jgi:polyribonucleotide nucleotidyltransferase